MVVTIDGPAGAGKSTIAKQLAIRLGFAFLDTGAMYRTVALAGLRANCDWNSESQLARIAKESEIRVTENHVYLNDEDVSQVIRTPEVTEVTKHSANNRQVRLQLVELQRSFAAENNANDKGVVTEGRDQGSLVFPTARCKIYLTATPEERARRRVADFATQGKSLSYEEVLRQQNLRDHQDESRSLGALIKADDAVEVLTDGMSPDEVIEELALIVSKKSN
ncbi:MAG: cytidylate kinase [Blastopirellula sp.]|nr:MAG: cytidylate kinase [Blastopirellula sp.]